MKWWIMVWVLLMAGCASLNPLDVLTDKPSIEVDAAIGKEVEQEESVIKVEQGSQKADVISNDTNYKAEQVTNVTNNIPLTYLLIAVLLGGWVIPDPLVCYKGFKFMLKDLVFEPIKGVANFLLVLAGREKL